MSSVDFSDVERHPRSRWGVVGRLIAAAGFDDLGPEAVIGRGVAVGEDRLVVDDTMFSFDELAPQVVSLAASMTSPVSTRRSGRPDHGTVEVPLAAGGSVPVATENPDDFTRALREAYQAWAPSRADRSRGGPAAP
ncbi:MAG: hypothetical protein ACRCYR_12820 [Phycicoccus sp.]